MKAVATFHQPTSVVGSIKTTLTEDEDTEYLVVAKSSILEVFAILPDALRLQCVLEIWGRITSLQAVPTDDENSQHHLLVLTDHPDPKLFLLEYVQSNAGSGPSLKTLKTVSLHERNARPTEYVSKCLVDHKGKVAVACSYTGKLRVLELEKGLINSEFDTAVRELNIVSLCFLRTTNARATALAILYKDYMQKLSVTSHDLSLADLELSPSPSSFLPEFHVPDEDSNLLIPVPPQIKSSWNVNGGVLVLGGSTIAFYSIDRKQKKKNSSSQSKSSTSKIPQAEVNWPYFDITAWAQIDEDGLRYLLGDSFGRLALLAINPQYAYLDIVLLGEVSPPTSLTPLASQYIYVGSHFGDSQLIRVTSERSSNGSYLEISDTFKNIAPIMDAVFEDTDDSGQPTIITCSGGESTGSLRVIRNGANFNEDARIEGIANITGMWPIRRQYDDTFHHYMLVTTDTNTHLLELPNSQQETAVSRSNDFSDLTIDSRTLVAGNMLTRLMSESGKSEYVSSSYVVQVSRDSVILLNTRTGLREDQWSPGPGNKIVLADISPSQICVAISGGTVVLLNLFADKINEQSRKQFYSPDGSSSEISALSISPMKRGANFSSFVALGFWSSHEVKVLRLPTFEQIDAVPVVMPHLPRSLLLCDFSEEESKPHRYLMVGLANGTVVSMPFAEKGVLGEKKFFGLGGAPVSLSRCEVNDKPAVFASGARSALFYRSKDTLSHSPVLIKDVTFASAIHSESFTSSMALSTLDGLVVGRVLELDKLHIRTVFMGKENPTKLAYHSAAKLLGVGCLKLDRSTFKGAPVAASSFKLVDTVDFRTTHEISLEPNEEITAVALVSLDCGIGWDTFFAVGSVYFDETEREPSRGRILIISTGSKRNQTPHILASTEVKGAVNALTCIQGKLVVAINTSVDVFRLKHGDNTVLTAVTSWNHNYLVITAVVMDDLIVIGDAVSSLAVLKLEDDKLTTFARDYSPLWPLCIGAFDNKTVIGANNDNNLFSYRLQKQGSKMLLDQDGLYNIEEIVNKCVPGCFDSTPNKFGLQTKQLLFTSTGRIAVVVNVEDDLSRLLSSLERNMAGVIKGPGDLDHTLWRAPSNSRGRSDANGAATGFLDGDLLERFLDYPYPSPEITRILSGRNEAEKIGTSYSEIRAILESLRSTH
ncbi:uncharacterized protein FOMMEDRAFT_162310 [Fomitiporia mediterranea MF3/22]|uniref:uncharacterized protein n=1 Tax=Fomitiporia mediterranea (strain MF3/22) TaxID=694068 RepID=UPI00044079F4|nr:uncharacterized protein FOMMEDRAFT_162310 [Fomitiporia mediterranea MF3/22]EJC97967.1 hypothetical protein FOMMEDRAFT_162310 [Fomitiporia mediterranea MF3/22]